VNVEGETEETLRLEKELFDHALQRERENVDRAREEEEALTTQLESAQEEIGRWKEQLEAGEVAHEGQFQVAINVKKQ